MRLRNLVVLSILWAGLARSAPVDWSGILKKELVRSGPGQTFVWSWTDHCDRPLLGTTDATHRVRWLIMGRQADFSREAFVEASLVVRDSLLQEQALDEDVRAVDAVAHFGCAPPATGSSAPATQVMLALAPEGSRRRVVSATPTLPSSETWLTWDQLFGLPSVRAEWLPADRSDAPPVDPDLADGLHLLEALADQLEPQMGDCEGVVRGLLAFTTNQRARLLRARDALAAAGSAAREVMYAPHGRRAMRAAVRLLGQLSACKRHPGLDPALAALKIEPGLGLTAAEGVDPAGGGTASPWADTPSNEDRPTPNWAINWAAHWRLESVRSEAPHLVWRRTERCALTFGDVAVRAWQVHWTAQARSADLSREGFVALNTVARAWTLAQVAAPLAGRDRLTEEIVSCAPAPHGEAVPGDVAVVEVHFEYDAEGVVRERRLAGTAPERHRRTWAQLLAGAPLSEEQAANDTPGPWPVRSRAGRTGP